MEFVPCPRCQEMNPPSEAKCSACGASMDEVPVEVAPLGLAQEPEAEPEEAPPPPAVPPHGSAPAVPVHAAAVPPHPSTAADPHAPVPHAGLPADLSPQVAALEQQITARPQAKALYIKLADLYQQAGQKDAAVGVLERLLGVDPGNALAKHRIDVLRGTVRHASRAVVPVHPVTRPTRPLARPAARRSSRRGLWIGLAAAAFVLVAVGFWLLSGPRRLVAGRSPVFSPRGDRIAYLTEAPGGAELSVYELKTGRSQSLGRTSAFGGEGIAWSPDGSQIAFTAPPEGEPGEAVYVAEVATGSRRALAEGSDPTWSPDGQSIAMVCHERPRVTATVMTEEGEVPTEFGEGFFGVCLVNVADGGVRRLHEGMESRLAFSPRARTLVFERFPESFGETGTGAEPAGGDDELQSLTEEAIAGRATNLAEGSRDLNRAIEARGLDKRRAQGVGSVVGDVFTLDADTGSVRALTTDGRSASPRWTPDGRIAYVHQPAGAPRPELWVMGADGSAKQALVQAPLELVDPSAVGVGGDRVVFAAPVQDVAPGIAALMTGQAPVDLSLVRPGDKEPRRLKNRHTFKQRFTLSSDGRLLVYEAEDRKTGQSELWLMKP